MVVLQVLSDLNKAAGELGLGPRPLSVNVNKEEGELEVTVKDGLTGKNLPIDRLNCTETTCNLWW